MAEPNDFDCPTCGASKGHPCQRVSLIPLNHNQRVYLAEESMEDDYRPSPASRLAEDDVTDVELPDPTTDETWGQG